MTTMAPRIDTVVIDIAQRAMLEAVARHAWPRECCGLLVGHREGGVAVVETVVTAPNVAPTDRPDRFEVDPAVHLRTQRTAREAGRIVLGVYHSHPNGRPTPSQTDRAGAHELDWIWLILAVQPDQAVTMAAYVTENAKGGVNFRVLKLS